MGKDSEVKSEIITIDTGKLTAWVEEGGKFLFKPEAEDALYNLLKAQKAITEAIDKVKKDISEAGIKAGGIGFRGVIGHRVSAISRFYGEKYTYDKEKEDLIKDSFLTERKYYKVNSKVVDDFIKKNNELPGGIIEKDREPQLTLKVEEKLLEE